MEIEELDNSPKKSKEQLEIEKLERELEELDNSTKKSKEQLEIEKLERELEELDNSSKKKSKKCKEQLEIEKLDNSSKKCKRQLEIEELDNSTKKIKKSKGQLEIEKLERELEELEKTTKKVSKKRVNDEEPINSLSKKSKLEKELEEIEKLEKELEDLENNKKVSKKRVNDEELEKSSKKSKSQLENLEGNLKKTKEEEDVEMEFEQLENEIEKLEEDLLEKRKHNKDIEKRKKLEKLNKEIEDLELQEKISKEENLWKTDDEDWYMPYFIICMDGRIGKIPKKLIKKIGTVIIDEAHLFCSKGKVECLLGIQPRYVIAESATLQRGDKLEKMIHLICGEHRVYRRSNTQYIVYRLDTGILVEEEQGARGINYGKLCLALGMDEYRNEIIINIIKNNPHRKFMILSKCVPHVKLLREILIKNKLKCDILCGSKNNYSDSHVLVGTMSKMGVGFDEKNACENFKGVESNVLFLAHSMAQWQLFEQYVGRVKRTSVVPIVIWLYDRNKMGRKHFAELEDWIKLTGGEIVPLKYIPNGIDLPELPKKSRIVKI